MADERPHLRNDDRASPFIPILILALAFVGWSGFQTTQLVQEKGVLATLKVTQDKQTEDSKKLRESLENLAKGTLALSNQGNPNARLIVDELRRRGITISPDTPPAAAPAAAHASAETKK
jgi:hypothetical protein